MTRHSSHYKPELPHAPFTGSLSLLALCLLLASCATRPPPTPVENWQLYRDQLAREEHWQLRGKLAVRTAEESEKARFSWRNTPDNYRIRLSGTLGMGTTYIKGDDGSVSLEQGGEPPVVAATPEQLIRDQLGRDIPVSHLRYWVRGISAPGEPALQLQISDDGLLTRLQQAGWQLSYTEYRAVGPWNLPGQVVATRDDVELTLSIYDWKLGAEDN